MRVCPRCRSIYATKAPWCGIDNTALVEQPDDPLIGTELERYRIVENLGLGGMGCVYRAAHTFIEREYAIKVLFGDFACDPKFRERFRREAKSISQIRHPNIVTVEDFGTTPEGLTFLAMEMVRGRTLENAIERESPFSPVRAAQILRQVVAGLGAAHSLGFIHRDVKPSNIMLSQQDGVELVKILDFGAVSMRSVPVDQRLTTVGHIIGTPTYMAPEQSQDPNVGPPADLYAAGVILYEMLTGSPPFIGKGRAEVLIKHIMEEPPKAPPSRGLEKIVAALLKKQPDERPQLAADVIGMIDALGLDLTILSDRPRIPQAKMPTAEVPGRHNPRRDFHSAPTRAQAPSGPEPERDLLGHDTFPVLGHPSPVDWSQWSADTGTDSLPFIDLAHEAVPTTSKSQPVYEGDFGGPTIRVDPSFDADINDQTDPSMEAELTDDVRSTRPTDLRPLFDEPELPSPMALGIQDDGPTQVSFSVSASMRIPRIATDEIPTNDLDSLIAPVAPAHDDPEIALHTAKTLSDGDLVMLSSTIRDTPVGDDEETGDVVPAPTLELPPVRPHEDFYEDSEESISLRARVIPVHDSVLGRQAASGSPRFWTVALIALAFILSIMVVGVVLWKEHRRAEPMIIDDSSQSRAATDQ